MDINSWISIIVFTMVWITSIVSLWIKINIKIKEMEMRIENNKISLERMEEKNKKYDLKLDDYQKLSRTEQQEMNRKMDIILQSLNDFKIYMEKRLK